MNDKIRHGGTFRDSSAGECTEMAVATVLVAPTIVHMATKFDAIRGAICCHRVSGIHPPRRINTLPSQPPFYLTPLHPILS
jgi:hypothetical protein